jgi:tRNA(Ile)-lysidine synthase
LIFVPNPVPAQQEVIPVVVGRDVVCGAGILTVQSVDSWNDFKNTPKEKAYFDASIVEEPLWIRAWRTGDRFQPLGMKHQKKISDFLTDEKVPVHLRDRVHVLGTGGHIVWVVGYRLAHPFRIRSETKSACLVSITPQPGQTL